MTEHQALAPDHGYNISTPKSHWDNVDCLGHFRQSIDTPIILDTNVNCAAVGERLFGSGQGLDSFADITIGTGIGVGLLIGGVTHGGANHPETGHIQVPLTAGDEDFGGSCPFHCHCLERLACGPAMRARWSMPTEQLPGDHRAWTIEADYIAALCATLTYVFRPDHRGRWRHAAANVPAGVAGAGCATSGICCQHARN